jgi:hypothetical protein
MKIWSKELKYPTSFFLETQMCAECKEFDSVHTVLQVIELSEKWQCVISATMCGVSHTNFRVLSQHLPIKFQFQNSYSQDLLLYE